MSLAYEKAFSEIGKGIDPSTARVLDCGAYKGQGFARLHDHVGLLKENYFGIEWNASAVECAQTNGLQVRQGDLNEEMPFDDGFFSVCYGLSVAEHLLRPCRWIRECHRVLRDDGVFGNLTPNISNYFTAFQLILGRMPSSGPYPDSNRIVNRDMIMHVNNGSVDDIEDENPVHRHHIIFSYLTLQRYLHDVGFRKVDGFGFGVYPFPAFAQPIVERLDKIHCHQMVFVCRK
ncbi:MAG: class I SAM-dependent methyltransferase [Opitutales bacterium]|nr:class I SAM-dependent methyltransferase [Opitutales bacterium]